jgi:hypothetical protein
MTTVKIESKMKNTVIYLIFVVFSFSNLHSQQTDSTTVYKPLSEFVVNRNFQKEYDRELERVKKIYPMALKAKAIMDEYEAEIAKLDKKREVKRYSKKMNSFLKEEFTYSIRDLYTSEGHLLMQLIHRETGKTVDQILTQYAGAGQAFIYRNMAKMFDQDLTSTYDSEKANYYTEIVISDILYGSVEFNPEMDKMTKESFKESQKQYRLDKKDTKKRLKEFKETQKVIEKQKKKEDKSKNKK